VGEHKHFGKDTRETIKENQIAPLAKPTYANIYVKTHSDCVKRETLYGSYVGQLGDVRRCDHNKVQILMKPERYARLGLAGPATWFWYTLHPIWDFPTYYKAVKAMG
jgi:hypothetical protein